MLNNQFTPTACTHQACVTSALPSALRHATPNKITITCVLQCALADQIRVLMPANVANRVCLQAQA